MNKILYSSLFSAPWVSANCCLLEDFPGKDQFMGGQYIRHPADIPIRFKVKEASTDDELLLNKVCFGGLCFLAARPIEKGVNIHIEIPIANSSFEADGVVAWCRDEEQGYSVGVCFDSESTQYGIRMVEQVCHIEHYRRGVFSEQGRLLTTEEAAAEWVDQYAGDFPH